MRLRAQFLSTVHPHGCFMLGNARDQAKVSTFLDSRLDRGADCVIDLDTIRSDPEHAHYFAVVGEAYKNLPEDLADDFQSAEHLRKWALCKSGHCDRSTSVCVSKAEARRLVAALQLYDTYVICEITGTIVNAYRAHSQSYDAMSASQFRKSKADVLEILSALLGVSVDELSRSKSRGKTQSDQPDQRTRLHGRDREEVPPAAGLLPPHERR